MKLAKVQNAAKLPGLSGYKKYPRKKLIVVASVLQ